MEKKINFGLFLHFHDKEKIFVENKTFLFFNKSNNSIVQYSDHSEHKTGEEEIILAVKVKNEIFIILNSFKPIASTGQDIEIIKRNKLWYLINNLEKVEDKNIINSGNNSENEDYYLCENDIIKFINQMFIVKEVHLNKKEGNDNEKTNYVYNIQKLNKNSKKIKFDTYYEIKNLQNSNFCEHIKNDLTIGDGENRDKKVNEIKEWIKARMIQTNHGKVKSYFFTLKKCNICNIIYPLRYKVSENTETIDLTDIKMPNSQNYIILESLKEIEDKKNIHIIELTDENQEIKIGSDETNDIIEESISKKQAIIKFNKKDGTLLLKNKSKKGTSILIKDNLQISDKKEIYLQEGKLFFTAKVIEKKEFDKKEQK